MSGKIMKTLIWYRDVLRYKIIEKLFVEEPRKENSEADPFEKSNSKTIINYLNNTQ